MSLQRSCCCGEPEICTVCECNTSYAVSGINLSYQFQRYKTNANQSCTCRYYEYNLVLSFTPATAVVVTKVAGGGCCYRGRFTVNVTGFLDLWQHYDSGSYCPPKLDLQNAYQISTTTCACITVVCNSKTDVCNGPSRAQSLVHTIEIGDFVIECNANLITAGDCDSCSQSGSYQLRCLGGRFQYSTDVGCLSSLSGVAFMGFHGNSQQFCGTGGPVENPGACYLNLESSIPNVGPFAVFAEEECDTGAPDVSCTDPLITSTAARTFDPSWAESLRVSLQSPCGSTDWSGRLFPLTVCPDEYDILQSGAPGFWNYL